MEIVHNQSKLEPNALNTRDGKNFQDTLLASERDLLDQLAEAFTIINGGQYKKRRLTA